MHRATGESSVAEYKLPKPPIDVDSTSIEYARNYLHNLCIWVPFLCLCMMTFIKYQKCD